MELPSSHAVTELTLVCSAKGHKEAGTCGTQGKIFCSIFDDEGEVKYLGPRVTGILPRISVRGPPLEGQQDLSGGRGVKHRVPFGDWDVHEFRWTPGSSRVKHFKSDVIT